MVLALMNGSPAHESKTNRAKSESESKEKKKKNKKRRTKIRSHEQVVSIRNIYLLVVRIQSRRTKFYLRIKRNKMKEI